MKSKEFYTLSSPSSSSSDDYSRQTISSTTNIISSSAHDPNSMSDTILSILLEDHLVIGLSDQRKMKNKEFKNYVPDQWCWSLKFKSDDVTVLDHKKKKAIFYPRWSDGTAAVRGDRVLNRGRPAKYYWEVHFPERLFGTSVMIGVATKYCRLRADSYTNLIGEDEQGWALSHRGMIWNSGFGKQFCKPFEENVKTTVGLLYDSRRGTLTYFKDGIELGVAFSGLETVKEELYPVVSSTAARIVAVLGDMSKFHYYNTLLDCCCDTILSRLKNSGDINCLPLPQSLQQYLVCYRD